MKKFIAGFLVGAILFSFAPVSAAVEEFICYRADYKVMVNGSEYVNADLPILNYKGSTYAPFKSILEKAGLNVTWNAELKQAEVTSNPTSAQINDVEVNTMSTTANIEYDPITGLPVGAKYIDNEKDGKKYKTVNYNSNIYISESDLQNIHGIKYIRNINTLNIAYGKNGNEVIVNFLHRDNILKVSPQIYINIKLFSELIGE